MSSLLTVTNLEPAYAATTGGPLVDYDGKSLLTGSCTIPHIASYSMSNGGPFEYPWIGCSNKDPGCCPFDPASAGPVSICPQDYSTVSGACCPSGWSVYTSTIASQTPCYTAPSLPLVAPTSSVPSNSPTPSIVSAQLFSLRYTLAQPSNALSNGARTGVIVGSIFGALLLAAAIFLFIRYRRRRAQAIRDATMPRSAYDPQTYASQKSLPMSPHSAFSRGGTISSTRTGIGTTISELPSPPPISPSVSVWPGGTLPSTTSTPPPPAMELPGSTFIHEHHPAFGASSPERVTSPVSGMTVTTGEETYRPPFASVERLPSPGITR